MGGRKSLQKRWETYGNHRVVSIVDSYLLDLLRHQISYDTQEMKNKNILKIKDIELQHGFLRWNLFIGQFVNLVEGEDMG